MIVCLLPLKWNGLFWALEIGIPRQLEGVTEDGGVRGSGGLALAGLAVVLGIGGVCVCVCVCGVGKRQSILSVASPHHQIYRNV